jgi:hypothetical protein
LPENIPLDDLAAASFAMADAILWSRFYARRAPACELIVIAARRIL